MKLGKIMKKGSAVALICALALPVLTLVNTQAADRIETGRLCSLTVKVDTESTAGDFTADLGQMSLPVARYKVADVDASGRYTELEGFQGLGLGGISASTTAQEWLDMAEAAYGKITDETQKTEEIFVAGGTGSVGNLATGMYLVVPEETFNQDYSYKYTFTPYLTALPGNLYAQGGTDEWLYDPVIGLKAEREEQYGSLIIEKTLSNYNESLGSVDFVFQVEAVKNGETVRSTVERIRYNGAGTQSVVVEKIPVGAQVTVTEVYSGASYKPEGEVVQETTIVAQQLVDAGQAVAATVSFNNKYDDRLIPGTGVVNHFDPPQEEGDDWNWTQK